MRPEVAKLTEAEREVLRLWQRRASAKEIALELGITHWAVNERLRSARRRLGVADSNEAARLLADSTAAGQAERTYNRVVYEPEAIAAAVEMPPIRVRERQQATAVGNAVREVQADFSVSPYVNRIGFRLPFPTQGETRNDLSTLARLGWIGGVAIGIIIAVGTLVTIAQGASKLILRIVELIS